MEGADDDGQKTADDPGERQELGIDIDEDAEIEEEDDMAKLKKKLVRRTWDHVGVVCLLILSDLLNIAAIV